MSQLSPPTGEAFTLFVYGTLKRGGLRHFILQQQTFLGDALTLPQYALYDLLHYPGLVHGPTGGRGIRGELYRVEMCLLDRLDEMEGAPTLFRMEPILLEVVHGPVYAYFYQGDIQGRSLCLEDCWVNA